MLLVGTYQKLNKCRHNDGSQYPEALEYPGFWLACPLRICRYDRKWRSEHFCKGLIVGQGVIRDFIFWVVFRKIGPLGAATEVIGKEVVDPGSQYEVALGGKSVYDFRRKV